MHLRGISRLGGRGAFALVAVVGAIVAGTLIAAAAGLGFSSLAAGFTQQLDATSSAPLGGVAFAPNGDRLVDECAFAGSPLHRFAILTTLSQNGSTLHPETVTTSGAGCGLANHPDGTLYSNTSQGVANLDANTAAVLRTFGVPGNALGIAVDP